MLSCGTNEAEVVALMPFLLIIAAAGVLGGFAARRLGLGPGLEAWVYRILLGMCMCALIAIALGSFSLLLAQTALGCMAVAGLLWEFRAYARQAESAANATPPMRLSAIEYVAIASIGAAWLLTLLSALAPVTAWDAAVAHIALPASYARAGRIFLDTGNVYSAYPQFMHALYAVAFYHGGEKPVTLLNWSFGALGCLSAYVLGARALNRKCGLIAAAMLATAPIYMDQAGGVSIDLAFTALATAALSAAMAYADRPEEQRWLYVSALLAGSACGVRHTGYLVCLLLALAVLFASRQHRAKRFLQFAGLSALAAGPWLLRSGLLVHNPVFPFLLSFFPPASIDHIAITALGAHESVTQSGGLSLVSILRFPWDIIMRPGRFDGWTKSPGGLILALGLPGILLAGKRARWLAAYSVAGGACFCVFQRLARYILPFFVPMMIVAAMAAVELKWFRRAVAVLLVLSFGFGLALHAAAIHFKVPVVLGLETREKYLSRRVERYPAFVFANQHLNTGGRILTPDQRSYYLDAPAYQNHWGMKQLLTMSTEQQLAWLQDHKIRYLMLPVTFVRESGALKDLQPLFNAWRVDRAHFRAIEYMTLPRVKGEGQEQVEFYEVLQ